MFLRELFVCLAIALMVQADSHESPFLDMSYDFKEGETVYWPNSEQLFERQVVHKGFTEYGWYYESYSFCAAEHGGTHLDAPAHFFEGGHRVHEIPLDTLIGPVIKIDMKAKADLDRDAELNVTDIEEWEEMYGRIPDDVILMVYTGWGARYPDRLSFLGTDTTNTSLLHFPGIHPDAAQWLVDNRKVKAVGIDTASLDHGPSVEFRTHVILFGQNIPGLENVANLDKLPTTGATIYMLPINIYDGSGAPCRIFATEWKDGLVDPYKVDRSTLGGQSPYLDMSHQLRQGMTPQWPGTPKYTFNVVSRGTSDVGFHYEMNSICTSEHIGSHMDAPIHIGEFDNGKYLHELSLDEFMGPAIKIDITEKARENPDAILEVSDLVKWEEENGRIEDGAIVLLETGWQCRWHDEPSYRGSPEDDDSNLHFPSFGGEAAQWLIEHRKIKAIGAETLSFDIGISKSLPVHVNVLGQNLTGYENVANLHKIPAKGATVFAIPMKIYEGSGAPMRIFATGYLADAPDPCQTASGHVRFMSCIGVIVMSLFMSITF